MRRNELTPEEQEVEEMKQAARVIKEMLRRHDEELLDEIDERERQRQDDERRRNYD